MLEVLAPSAPSALVAPLADDELSWPESEAEARVSADDAVEWRKTGCAGGGVLGVLASESGGPMTGVLGARDTVTSSSSTCIISSSPSSGLGPALLSV